LKKRRAEATKTPPRLPRTVSPTAHARGRTNG
jgi:hypothetical protein